MLIQTNGAIPEGKYGFMNRTEQGWAITQEDGSPVSEIPMRDEFKVLGRTKYRLLGLSDGSARVIRFSDLHRHSDNSLQDGMTKVKEMVKRTEYSGALTDHGNMYGFLEYYKGMRAAGKKPVLGFEGYMENLDGSLTRRHVILLAKNDVGYKNLLKLTSESFDHFKMKPHVTWDMLAKYHEGIICLSACLAGLIPTAIKEGNLQLAETIIQQYIDIFGKEDFYIELQRHHIEEEDMVRPKLVYLAEKYGLKTVATTDSHYPDPEDREAHDVLLCLQTEKTINDEKRMRYQGDGYFLHNSEQMEELFSDFPEALDNTLEIAEKCNVEIKLGDVNLPNYDIPAPFKDTDEYMLHIAKEGFHNRFGGTPLETDQTYIDRFNYEAEMIKKMGFSGYFIIVWDFINYAKSHNIYVGPGRGSAAGSMVAYCMGITDMDPIKYNLLFERFLNPERISYPDIDTDIEHVGRPKVIQYMIQKYGADHVCRIVTFGTFAAKQSMKDVARVFEYPSSFGSKLASMVPDGVGMTIEKALEESVELQNTYKYDEDARRVIDVAKRIEGGKRHASQHACFDESTLITTSDGLKYIKDVAPGDKVLTHNNRFKPVVSVMENHSDDIYHVSFHAAPTITVTGNHPLLIKNAAGEVSWKEVQYLSDSDYACIPINNESIVPEYGYLPTDKKEFWWIVGYYIAHGTTETKWGALDKAHPGPYFFRRVSFPYAKGKESTENSWKLISKLLKCGFSVKNEENDTHINIISDNSAQLFHFLQEACGQSIYSRMIPPCVIDLPNYLAASVLEGFMAGSGYEEEEKGIICFRSVGRGVAYGIAQLINKVYHWAVDIIATMGNNLIVKGDTVGTPTPVFVATIHPATLGKKDFYFEKGQLWVRVKELIKTGKSQSMYNLTVMDDSSYQANGIAAHNCGLCVAPSSVSDFLPTSMEVDDETGEKALTSQVIMTEVEELSLIKMDLLGLKNMSVIHEVMDAVTERFGEQEVLHQIHSDKPHLKFQDIPLNDRATYKMLAQGLTGGVFQLESPGMTRVITQMMEDVDTLPDDRLEECFERLIAAVALYRPGPMDYIPDYITGMNDPASIHYDCPQEAEILSTTYGVMVYQEQLMQIAQHLAGYNLGEADILRKACGKKKKDMMAKEQTKFIGGNQSDYDSGKAKHLILGCTGNGIPQPVAEEIWEKMTKFASYAFNRSHAACYAWIAYITAYMSCHWPSEFYAAMLNAFIENSDKVKAYLAQANNRSIKLMLPDIQKSVCHFSSIDDSGILFGLQGISGLKGMATYIVNERTEHGAYKGLQDLYERLASKDEKLNKKCIEGLVYSGALRTFSDNKAALLEQYNLIESNYKADATNRALNQISLFGVEDTVIQLPDVRPFSQEFALTKEQETLGMFVSSHPTDLYEDKIKEHIEVTPMDKLVQIDTPMRSIKTIAMIKDIRQFYTKQRREMASFTAETKYASISCVVFPDNMDENKPFLNENSVYCINGGLIKDNRGDGMQLSVQSLSAPDFVLSASMEAFRVLIFNKAEQDYVLHFIKTHPGDTPIILMAAGREFHITPKVRLDDEAINFFSAYNNRISATM